MPVKSATSNGSGTSSLNKKADSLPTITGGSKLSMPSDNDKNYSMGKMVSKDKNKSTMDTLIKNEPKTSPSMKVPSTQDTNDKVTKDYVKVPTIKKKI